MNTLGIAIGVLGVFCVGAATIGVWTGTPVKPTTVVAKTPRPPAPIWCEPLGCIPAIQAHTAVLLALDRARKAYSTRSR